ncbi:hypothetical protein CHELA41_24632 [Hyphomicrobiales bacterium]|nr:hypothetical protein CHELA41_24632 [Hyphomicrobiales bacterium]
MEMKRSCAPKEMEKAVAWAPFATLPHSGKSHLAAAPEYRAETQFWSMTVPYLNSASPSRIIFLL